MGYVLDTAFGRALAVNKGAVAYHKKTSKTGYAPAATIPDARPEMVTVQNYVDGVLLIDRQLAVNIWRSALEEAGLTGLPKPHDVIELDGARHSVTRVEHCNRDAAGKAQRFRCFLERE